MYFLISTTFKENFAGVIWSKWWVAMVSLAPCFTTAASFYHKTKQVETQPLEHRMIIDHLFIKASLNIFLLHMWEVYDPT